MKAEKLNSWLSLGANIGVVIGLILLIVEIGQNTEMLRAQINQSRTDTALSDQQAGYNSDYIPTIRAKIASGEHLSDEEMIRYEGWFRAFNRNMDNQLWQYNQGLLGENIPRSIRSGVREVIGGSVPGLEQWDAEKLAFTDEYIAFVDDTIEDLR